LAIHRRRASTSGETSSKPLFCFGEFFKFSKNLRQNIPFQNLFFAFWRNFAQKKKNAAVEALRKKERQDETQFTTQTGGKTSLGPSYFAL